jgi:hypothetical protein
LQGFGDVGRRDDEVDPLRDALVAMLEDRRPALVDGLLAFAAIVL